MEEERTVLHKSFLFAQRMVHLYKHLLASGQPRALADQLLRSGTSIGANMEEATGEFSKRDFIAKCSIAYKEARETHYWLRLPERTECLKPRLANSLELLSAVFQVTINNYCHAEPAEASLPLCLDRSTKR